MAEDRANYPSRVFRFDSSAAENTIGKAKDLSSVYTTGGKLKVNERTPEQSGPRTMTKFDSSNKEHVNIIKSGREDLLIHPGGKFSVPAPKKKAPKMSGTTLVTGTREAAQARQEALVSNEQRMKIARQKLAEKKKNTK